MTNAARLKRTLTNFLRLETFAEALYRQHLRVLPKEHHVLFTHFADIEAHHRQLFQEIYETIHKQPAPRFRLSLWGIRIAMSVLHLFGQKAILRFECWVERRAVRDYTAALGWLSDPRITKVVKMILKEEQAHLPLVELFCEFRADEETHIRKMTALLKR